MDREIIVTLTPQLIRWTLFYQFRPFLLFFGFVFLGMFCNLFFLIFHAGTYPMEAWINFLPEMLIPVFLGVVFYYAYYKNKAMIRKMKTPVVKYHITDEWLYVDSDLTSGKTAWAVYKELRKNAKLWRVVTQAGTAHALPTELLDDELKAFLTEKLPKPARSWKRNPFTILAFWLLVFVVVMYFLRQGHH